MKEKVDYLVVSKVNGKILSVCIGLKRGGRNQPSAEFMSDLFTAGGIPNEIQIRTLKVVTIES